MQEYLHTYPAVPDGSREGIERQVAPGRPHFGCKSICVCIHDQVNTERK